jgi:hypothetical protein
MGAELVSIAKDDRETYLAKQAEAQFSVPEAELVEGVRKVLARASQTFILTDHPPEGEGRPGICRADAPTQCF